MSVNQRILVDGMNLIYKFPDLAFYLVDYRLNEAREGLLAYLWQFYKDEKNCQVLVFFDGKKDLLSDCYSEDYEGMSVHYSHDQKADDLIIGYLKQAPIPSHCLVVTSDKEIVNFARRIRAKRKTSEEFYKDWLASLEAKEDAEIDEVKEGLTATKDRDYWEKQFLA
ncbi:RNA-binding protein [Leptospira kobayashii]|uniref:RNA-binding protein n=1 Tax=Leptospira kobayashii TaxID=1917830 RepID=A0ABN6KFZ7_9LEPT|nr:NYN domain-containing protein [Leptospira kobayashii]BDA80090.1 RNA-binding protein [Leptospira kobayashii]